MQSPQPTASSPSPVSASASSRTGSVIAAVFLGALFIYVTGFMPAEAVHDFAHDTRHSVTFPCH